MSNRKTFLLLIALVEWFGVITQLVLQQQTSTQPFAASITRFFSYYTILTNLLVAVFATVTLFSNRFTRAGLQTGIAYHITIVGLVYNLLLRRLFTGTGLQAVISDVLHSVTPLLFFIYWWICVNAKHLRSRVILTWLIYPAIYTVYTLTRGSIVHWYPYFFLDVDKYGYRRVLLNSTGMLAGFLLLGALFLLLAKRKPA